MTTNLHSPSDSTMLRCPQCAALRAPAAQWCTQCYQRFEPEPTPESAPAQPTTARHRAVPNAPEGAVDEPADALTEWDARYRAAATDLDDQAVAERAESLMAELSGQHPGLDATTSSIARIAGSPSGKVLVIVVGGAVLLGTALLAMFVLGQLL